MQGRLSPTSLGRHRSEDAAWTIGPATRHEAQEADACSGGADWQYAPTLPLPPPPPPAAGPATAFRHPLSLLP